MAEQQYKLFLDLDGVFANFMGGVSKLLNKHIDGNYISNPKARHKMWDAIKVYHESGGNFWEELEMLPDAQELWNYVSKHNPVILSSTGSPAYGAEIQKPRWVANHLSDTSKVHLVSNSRLKAQFASPNNILIDDLHKSINPWVEAGGIGILHTSATKTINDLKFFGL